MFGPHSPRTAYAGLVVAIVATILTAACGSAGQSGSSASPADPSSPSWQAILSPQDVATVRQTYANFQPELFAPGANPASTQSLTPLNFVPAQFFGPPEGTAMEKTPLGISVETNGYDGTQVPLQFPNTGTYFDRGLNPHVFHLDVIARSPLNVLEGRMNVPATPNAATLSIDLSDGRINLADIDQEMLFIRDQIAARLPAVANIDPTTTTITIEPSIVYVTGSNMGSTWAGGRTQSAGGADFQIHVAAFYMTMQPDGTATIINWKDVLIDEAINFYAISIGRSDLAL